MRTKLSFYWRLLGSCVVIFAFCLMPARSQDTPKYREDYARMQKIEKNNQAAKRADEIIVFLKERSDLDARIREYIKGLLAADLRKLKVQNKYSELKELCERAINVNPMLGEVYLYYGYALKNEKKDTEAMNAFAKGHLIQNPSMQQAKQELDKLYKATHRGSLAGEEKLISTAIQELNKVNK
jgi:tetratricopeptide (TPR) repeat protein